MDSKLHDIIYNPSDSGAEACEALMRQYPYFAIPAIALLRHHRHELDDQQLQKLKFHIAMVTGDRNELFSNTEGAEFKDIYPRRAPKPPVTTENALDTFFATYGTASDTENALLEKLIFNPTPEYAEILAADDIDTPAQNPAEGSLEACIDRFIAAHKPSSIHSADDSRAQPAPPAPTRQSATPTPPSDSSLSESLAKIFVKQGRYERAYEIISGLSLNNPKKSIYFADQMRFLQKLIKIKQTLGRND